MLVLHPEQLTHIVQIDATTLMYMLMVSTVTGLGYAAWNIGINRGNITMLVTLSYFSPIFSSIMSMWILQTPLSKTFWLGAIMVTLGDR
ncbi:EamA family transporter, partial [Escherichia coli]